jgi:hypothetical protein
LDISEWNLSDLLWRLAFESEDLRFCSSVSSSDWELADSILDLDFLDFPLDNSQGAISPSRSPDETRLEPDFCLWD